MSARKTKFRATVEVKLTTDKTDEAESIINDWLAGESQPDSEGRPGMTPRLIRRWMRAQRNTRRYRKCPACDLSTNSPGVLAFHGECFGPPHGDPDKETTL